MCGFPKPKEVQVKTKALLFSSLIALAIALPAYAAAPQSGTTGIKSDQIRTASTVVAPTPAPTIVAQTKLAAADVKAKPAAKADAAKPAAKPAAKAKAKKAKKAKKGKAKSDTKKKA